MPSTYTFAELGVHPSRPGDKHGDRWSVMFQGGDVQNAIVLDFDERPEGRAVSELMDHFGATSHFTSPPTSSVTSRIQRGVVCGLCADEGAATCNCWAQEEMS